MSVVVTTFRRPDRVVVAVGSALAQTERDLEVLVVDDNPAGSDLAHATRDALREHLQDPRVRHLPMPNPGGGSAARNAGIRASQAPWVAFLDDDDRWEPDKLERQLAALAAAGPQVVLAYTGFTTVDDRERVLSTTTPRPGRSLYPALLGRNLIGTTSSVVVRRDVLLDVGGFDEELPAAQDRDLYIRVCRHHGAVAVPAPLVTFVSHGSDRVTKDKGAKYEAMRRLLDKYREAYDRHPRMRSRVRADLGRFAWLTGDPASARKHLARAILDDPTHARAYALWVISSFDPVAYKRWRNRRTPTGDAAGEGREPT